MSPFRTALIGATAVGALLLSGCATGAVDEIDPAASGEVVEVDAPQPRLAVLYDGGVIVLDASTLAQIADVPTDATRLAEAGDGRHLMLTTELGFEVLDGGAWTETHGDHGHSFVGDPVITGQSFPMDGAGHVVAHAQTTALFSDAEGAVTLFTSSSLSDEPAVTRIELPAPHHGVAVPLDDATLLVTAGTDESRSSVVHIAADGAELARTDACPGVHGETVAANDAVLFGCADAVVVFEDGAFRSIALPDAGTSVGGPRATESSSVVLADYATGDELEPERVALIDLATDVVTVVDLPAGYYYWSLARGPHDEALVLGTDGSLHVLDPATGELIASVPVLDAWSAPDDWRDPAPSVTVLEHIAYVSDPAGESIHAIDLDTLEVTISAALDVEALSVAAIRG